MKYTVLQLTQNILASLNSDEVNSIGDTVESNQVAQILQNTYFNMVAREVFPEHTRLFHLTPSNDESQPILMFKPEDVSKVNWIKYFDTNILSSIGGGSSIHDTNVDLIGTSNNTDASPNFKYVTILPTQQFLDMVGTFNTNQSNVDTFTFTEGANTFTFNYKDDKQPQFCTVIQNYYFIFDSFDGTQDSTLQASKILCSGNVVPAFRLEDNFVPDLNDQQFPLLLNEAKSLAFMELKNTQHPKAEQEAKRQWGSAQKTMSLVDKPSYFDQLPNFGRRC